MTGTGKRLKGVTHVRAIIYGSTAVPLGKKDVASDPSHTHKWSVYLRGLYGEDMSYLIKKVVFKLHESFASPVRTIESPPFEVHETGWGEFEIMLKVHFQDSTEKPVTLYHQLTLYPKDEGATPAKRTVVAEHYDELIFNEPTEETHENLLAHPQVSLGKKSVPSAFTAQAEQDELRKIAEAQEKVLKEFERHQMLFKKAEAELQKIQGLVKAEAE
ncbi:YEATS domain-containing protein 4 [Borealophlyctis nickersoniae]|nr:YEATS domain-containing protein 4 [Borealophlyctis nickersoniae]